MVRGGSMLVAWAMAVLRWREAVFMTVVSRGALLVMQRSREIRLVVHGAVPDGTVNPFVGVDRSDQEKRGADQAAY